MKKITDYKPLPNNPNKGTQRGTGILDQSVRQFGAGRSILVDKNGIILAGNHAQEAFINAGLQNVIEVETDGTSIVVVRRTDVTADSVAGKKMAILDNRTTEVGLAWDADVLGELIHELTVQDKEIDLFLADLAKDTGLDDLPSLEDLEDEYGLPENNGFWPYIKLQVPPETKRIYDEIMEKIEGTDEAEKFSCLLIKAQSFI